MSAIENKILHIKNLFPKKLSLEERYKKILDLGKKNPPLENRFKIPENRVEGGQSTLYLVSHCECGNIFFKMEADALFSAGLAILLLSVYSGESAYTILTTPPTFLEDLGFLSHLTPSRSNGLAHIHRRIKMDAFVLQQVSLNQ